MNDKEQLENWKRKLIQLENKVGELNNDKNILINLVNEVKTNQNIKLNHLLRDLDLEEEISYLKDWIEFYKEKITLCKNGIELSEKELVEKQLEDLGKETVEIEEEKEVEQKKEFEDTFEIEVPSEEELEKDVEETRIETEEREVIKEQVKELFIDKKELRKPLQLRESLRIVKKPIEKIVEKVRKFDRQKLVRKSLKLREKLSIIKSPIENGFREIRKLDRQKLVRYAVPAVMLLLIVSVLFVSKPEITGYVVLSEKNTYDDNLGLVINESGNYTWTIDKIGDIESIKASGRVKGNGSVKIYIEKDGERYLIFDNKKAND